MRNWKLCFRSFSVFLLIFAILTGSRFSVVASAAEQSAGQAAAVKIPDQVTVSEIKALDTNRVKLQWEKTKNATEYKVSYKLSGAKEWISLGMTKNTGFVHTGSSKAPLAPGNKYLYIVRAYNSESRQWSKSSSRAAVVTIPTAAGAVKTVNVRQLSYNKTEVKWSKVKEASQYRILYKAEGAAKWINLATVSGSATAAYVHTATKAFPLSAGKKYVYTVQCYDRTKRKWSTGNAETGITITGKSTVPGCVEIDKYSSTGATVTVSWKAAENATEYYVYAGTGLDWKLITVVKDRTYTLKKLNGKPLNPQTYYTICVKAYNSISKKMGSYDERSFVEVPTKANPMKKITLNKSTLTITNAGSSQVLTASWTPYNENAYAYCYSADEGIVSVGQGKRRGSGWEWSLVPHRNGTVELTVYGENDVVAKCKVKVAIPNNPEGPFATSVTLDKSRASIKDQNQTLKLNASVLPKEAVDKAVLWKSMDPKIAKVDSTGKVTPVSNGTVEIRVCLAKNSGIYESCYVTVDIPDVVKVQGVTFDMGYFPKTLSVGDDMECLSVMPQQKINPKDITYKIDNGNAQLLCDPDTPNLYKGTEGEFGWEYYVSDWKNMIAYVDANYDPDMYLQYRVEIYNALKTGSFSVSAYYKGTLLRTSTVKVTTVDKKLTQYRQWITEIEKKVWKTGMTTVEKVGAIGDYIYDNYTYTTDGMWCNDGACALLFGARDLGLTARYRFVGPQYDYQKGLGDVYYHFGSAFCGGHVCTIVTIDGENYRFESQGHPG